MSFILRIRERQAEITAEIAALVAERDDLDAALRVFGRLGADTPSTAAGTDRLGTEGKGGVSLPPDRTLAELEVAPLASDQAEPGAGAAAPPVDTLPPQPDRAGLPGATAPGERSSVGEEAATGKSGEPSGSPAPSLRSRIIALHREHPEYTAREAVEELECKRSSLTAYSTQLQIKWAEVSRKGVGGRPGYLRDKVVALHREHPEFSAFDIARELNVMPEYVRTTAKRQGLVLPSRRTATQIAPETEDEPVTPSVARKAVPAPALNQGLADGTMGATVLRTAPRPLSGSKFYLVNDKGEYLNRFCAGFTADRREAWIGNQQQLVGCRRNFEIARDLRERPVTKELPPAPINREVA